jgi:voltage-gated potassium channel
MSAGVQAKWPVSGQNNFAYLAAALVLLLFGLALTHELGLVLGQVAVEAAFCAALATGVWSMHGDHQWHATRLGLLAGLLMLLALRFWLVHSGLDFVWLGVLLAYLVVTTWSAMRLVLFSGPVDRNKVIGSFCIYLLLGIIWATVYMMLAEYRPGAFDGLTFGSWHETFPNLLYFSFITLTTIGYGDITPAAPVAQFLAFMEAIIGQFYMAVLVASLVGIGISNRRK